MIEIRKLKAFSVSDTKQVASFLNINTAKKLGKLKLFNLKLEDTVEAPTKKKVKKLQIVAKDKAIKASKIINQKAAKDKTNILFLANNQIREQLLDTTRQTPKLLVENTDDLISNFWEGRQIREQLLDTTRQTPKLLVENTAIENLQDQNQEVTKLLFNKDISVDTKDIERQDITKIISEIDNVVNIAKANMPINTQELVNYLILELDKKTDEITKENIDNNSFIEEFTFLDNAPKISKLDFGNYSIKNLYSKIDSIVSNNKIAFENNSNPKINNNRLDILPIIEELEIPEMISLEDDSKSYEEITTDNYLEIEPALGESYDNYISNFKENKDKNNNLELNPQIKENINKINEDLKKKENANLNEIQIPKTQKPKEQDNLDIYTKNISINLNAANTSFVQPPQNQTITKEDNKTATKEFAASQNISYMLPKDYSTKDTISVSGNTSYKQSNSFQNLVFSSKIKIIETDLTKIYEKYNLDDFTYVTISYKNNLGLYYNIIQPELNSSQENMLSKIKLQFFENIDRSYYSFKGDSKSLEKYLEKIYSICVDKLSYNLTSLESKLYFYFIEREFSGLGMLYSLLKDNQILEISCAGEKTAITVYHLKYGLIETNLSFENITKLNLFILG
ncbi:MAG: hypothetical protein V1824_03005, partial [archaeon]